MYCIFQNTPTIVDDDVNRRPTLTLRIMESYGTQLLEQNITCKCRLGKEFTSVIEDINIIERHDLDNVCPIQTIDTIHPEHTLLL